MNETYNLKKDQQMNNNNNNNNGLKVKWQMAGKKKP